MTVGLPPPSPEMVIVRVAIEAYLETVGRRKGEKFLRSMATRLMNEDRLSEMLPIRAASETEAVQEARRKALSWYRAVLPQFIDKL